MKKLSLLIWTLLSVAFFSVQAQADAVVITGGSAVQYFNYHTYDLVGQGFSASALGYWGRTPCVPCMPGDSVRLYNSYVGEDQLQSGPATYNGIDYPQLWYLGGLTFETGSLVIPPTSGSGVMSLEVPFTLTGSLRGYFLSPAVGNPGPALFNFDVTGQGIAVLELSYFPNAEYGTLYSFRTITYNFQTAPVPEPATLILLGSGLTGLVAALRRRRNVMT